MKRQHGLSMIGFLGMLIVGGLAAFLAMRLFPVYSEHHSVVTCMRGLAADPAAAGKDITRLRSMLAKRFQVSYVESVKAEDISVDRSGGDPELVVEYEVRRPLAYNLDFVARFSDRVALRTDSMPE